MNPDWEIKSRSHSCHLTGHPFAEGDFFYTLLFRDGAGFRREDISEDAWKNRNDNIQPFSFWRSKYEPPIQKKADHLPANDAERLLRELLEENRPETIHARFILALMLERKKLLRPIPNTEKKMLVYELTSTHEVFALQDPELTLDQIPSVQKEVAELLNRRSGAIA